MARRKNRKRLIFWILAIVIIISLPVVFLKILPEPPLTEVEMAGMSLAKARDNQAEIYATDLYDEANQYYDSAMSVWRKENERFILLRDYSRVTGFASLSVEKSEEALKQTIISSADLEKTTTNKLNKLNELLKEMNGALSRFPLPEEISSEIARGKLLFSEAKIVYSNKQYTEADKMLNQTESILESAHNKAFDLIINYFKGYNQWSQWMEQTITESRNKKTTAVIVDKYAGKCFIYKNGKRVNEFDAELGKKWMGDKRHKGDNTTPEGRYRIIKKKEGSATKYYKALLIDYPNNEDKQRFQAAIADGTLPRNSHIGGLIEIHGHGGKGADWTEGCVALVNSDMDKIFRLVNIGTPITIIGSISSFDEIFKN